MLSSRWRGGTLALVVVGVGGLAGCASGGGTSAESAASASALAVPEQLASAAQVATGLRKIERIAREIAGSSAAARASAPERASATGLDRQIEPIWKTIEGTTRRNDQDTYLAMEDNFAVLGKAASDGDTASASTGSAGISAAVRSYLAKYPG